MKYKVRLTNLYFWNESEHKGRLNLLLADWNGKQEDNFCIFNIEQEDEDKLHEILYNNGDIFDYENIKEEVK